MMFEPINTTREFVQLKSINVMEYNHAGTATRLRAGRSGF